RLAALVTGEAEPVRAPTDVSLRPGLDEEGRVALVPVGGPGEWLEAAVWAQVLLAQADGTWQRLKLCREPACRSAFYDRSRNNSGVWHDVRRCGNAANLRASRARRKQQAAEAPAGE
ncbi:CGNR zinc finger domain-containing protein, partial [Actinospica acidiphila]